ncbi:hypothetical protein [Nonomuraea sp. GTA35]|uniref:hypothetical protein n=1 Tax=Nonomuraea sp. GTA35 TaxID=1676746 RepID=UPI0035C1BA28
MNNRPGEVGNSAEVCAMAAVLVTVIDRIAPRRGCRAALLTAGEVVADGGPGDNNPDAVAVVAVARVGRDTAVGWCGDARIYGFDGERLRFSEPRAC